jgi:hypothetical protein
MCRAVWGGGGGGGGFGGCGGFLVRLTMFCQFWSKYRFSTGGLHTFPQGVCLVLLEWSNSPRCSRPGTGLNGCVYTRGFHI